MRDGLPQLLGEQERQPVEDEPRASGRWRVRGG
jgi:hypothetical protein